MVMCLNASLCFSKEITVEEAFETLAQNPGEMIARYTPFVPESAYLTQDLTLEAAKQLQMHETAKIIHQNFNERPKVVLSDLEAPLKRSQFLIDHAQDIVHGITNEYVDCKAVKHCTTVYDDRLQTCVSPIPNQTLTCEQTRAVHVEPGEKISKSVMLTLQVYSRYGGDFVFDLKQGRLISSSVSGANAHLDADMSQILGIPSF